MGLASVREALGFTQTDLAVALGVTQSNVAQTERRKDILVSTLARYLGAIGADLHLVVRFEGRPPVEFSLDELERSTPEDVKHERLGGTEIGGPMASERTGKKAASNAGHTLGVKKATKAAKSASGSALAQTKSSGVTGKKAASSAGATLRAKKSTKAAKSAAGSALTQKPTKKARTS